MTTIAELEEYNKKMGFNRRPEELIELCLKSGILKREKKGDIKIPRGNIGLILKDLTVTDEFKKDYAPYLSVLDGKLEENCKKAFIRATAERGQITVTIEEFIENSLPFIKKTLKKEEATIIKLAQAKNILPGAIYYGFVFYMKEQAIVKGTILKSSLLIRADKEKKFLLMNLH